MTTVTRSGQITLDKRIRKAMGIEVGTPLEVNKLGEMIIITKKDKHFWRRHKPVLPADFPEILKKIRKDTTKRYQHLFKK